MAKFELKIESSNGAFEDEPAEEMARILRFVADMVDDGRLSGQLLDINGNAVGLFMFDGRE